MSPFSGSVLASFYFYFCTTFSFFASLVFLWEGGQGFVWTREKDCHRGGVVEELVLSDGKEYYFRRRVFGGVVKWFLEEFSQWQELFQCGK